MSPKLSTDLPALYKAALELEDRLSAALQAIEPRHGTLGTRDALHRARVAQRKVARALENIRERR
jgi:hypothetical protein